MQDIAVVPLLLLISALAEREGGWTALEKFRLNVGGGVLLSVAIFLLSKYVLPHVLHMASAYRNRDLPVLLAIVYSLGGAGVSHALGLSPVLGAFVAGMLLAESPFAHQLQADIVPLLAGFVTLFFASIGTMAVIPEEQDLITVAALVVAILLGKALIVALVVALFHQPSRAALATGLALAQIGEFSFVLVELGHRQGLLARDIFHLLLSASVVTLLLTPYVISAAPRVADTTLNVLARLGMRRRGRTAEPPAARQAEARVVVVGFGPAGQEVVSALRSAAIPFLVIDLNPRPVDAYRSTLPIVFGDATRQEILEHARLPLARALLVTIPDPQTAGLIVGQAKRIAPTLPVIARSRYHIHASLLREAGADHLVDEEFLVGQRLGEELVERLRRTFSNDGA